MSQFTSLRGQPVFRDKHGHIAVWQTPNIPLWGWLVLKLIALPFKSGRMKTGLSDLSTAFLFTWAFLEVTKGINLFRRALGLVVLGLLVASYFTD